MVNRAWRPLGELGPGINEIAAYDRADLLPYAGCVTVLHTGSDIIMIRASGSVDGRVTADLRSALVTVLLRLRPRVLLLDLGQVSRVDAAGTGTIVAGCQVAEDCGIEVVVDFPGPDIANQLRQSGLPASARAAA